MPLDAAFCDECGTKLPETQEPEQQVEATQQVPEVITPEDAGTNFEEAMPEKEPSKKKLIAIIAAVAVAAAACVVIFLNFGGTTSSYDRDTLFTQGLVQACTDGKWGYVDKEGNYVINPQFDAAYTFSDNGLAVVEVNNKYGYIDKKGNYVINPQFDDANYFTSDGLAVVESGDV